MTNISLYDALEICLQALEQGEGVEACLARFPTLAEELRPILETAAQARSTAVEAVPDAVLRRSKARVLQAAAEMREQAVAPRRSWRLGRVFRLAFTALATIFFLLAGGSGLVRASDGALPGDNLYTVKRSWEDVQIFFAIDPESKAELEDEFEQERLHEVNELFQASRREQVYFLGTIASQQGEIWEVAGLQVKVESETRIEGEIIPGSRVEVWGKSDDGQIEAQRIRLLAAPSATFTPAPTLTVKPTSTLMLTLSPTHTLAPAIRTPTATPTLSPTATFTSLTVVPTRPAGEDNDKDNSNNENGNDNSNDNDDDNDNGDNNSNDNDNDNDNGNG